MYHLPASDTPQFGTVLEPLINAPSAIYLYIDKEIQDHGLFQAICRVNRLDGSDKEYGYIVDYKDLFKPLGAIAITPAAPWKAMPERMWRDCLKIAWRRVGSVWKRPARRSRPSASRWCPPKTRGLTCNFCAADTSDKAALEDDGPKRIALYKAVAALVRAFASSANELAGGRLSQWRNRSDPAISRLL